MSWPRRRREKIADEEKEETGAGRGASTAYVVWAISNPASSRMIAAPNAKAWFTHVFLSREFVPEKSYHKGANGDG